MAYKNWSELTANQQSQAQRQGIFIGYSQNELKGLKFGIEKGKVASIRDDRLLSNVFNVRGRRPKLRRQRW